MRSFINSYPVIAALGFVAMVVTVGGIILDGREIVALGLPGYVWAAIGAIVFMGIIIVALFRQHQSLEKIATGSGSASVPNGDAKKKNGCSQG